MLSCKIDKTAPTVTLSGSGTTLTATHQDNLSGVIGYTFTTSASSPSTNTFTVCDAVNASTQRTSSGHQDNTFYCYVVDSAGNVKKSNSMTECSGTLYIRRGDARTSSRKM